MKMRLLIICACAILIISCENPMTFRTKVNEDGSLDKTITFEKAEEKVATNNIYGISEKNGWATKVNSLESSTEKAKDKKFRIELNKHFASDQELNKELDNTNDSLFHVHSQFEKKFRWFYTYIRYSETIRPINRFKMVSPRDFFNQEDSLFIQRLPAEGKPISKADSLYLQILNEKINDRFATLAIFKETIILIEAIVRKNTSDKKWLDTLSKNWELVYKLIENDQKVENLIPKVFDTLSIPVDRLKAAKDFDSLSKELTSRTHFMSFARDGKYLNAFEMPWDIVSSNADSLAGRNVYWKPLVNKFALSPYEMYAECRKMNWWAVAISAGIVFTTLILLWKKRT
ncbi:MAG TPA: hypothetical protein VL728_00550 [Cyclobacteriaceae bacterium]|jgi:hypothetical protein|nr:hypothetical protein [Cyclobacteriaceae bacterium]